MPFEKGRKKTGGIKKGQSTKTTLARLEILKAASEDFASKLRDNKIDPLEQIASDLAALDPFERCQIMLALCKFKYPTLKAIDPKKLDNPYAGLTKVELLAQMKAGAEILEQELNDEMKGEPSRLMDAKEIAGEDE